MALKKIHRVPNRQMAAIPVCPSSPSFSQMILGLQKHFHLRPIHRYARVIVKIHQRSAKKQTKFLYWRHSLLAQLKIHGPWFFNLFCLMFFSSKFSLKSSRLTKCYKLATTRVISTPPPRHCYLLFPFKTPFLALTFAVSATLYLKSNGFSWPGNQKKSCGDCVLLEGLKWSNCHFWISY